MFKRITWPEVRGGLIADGIIRLAIWVVKLVLHMQGLTNLPDWGISTAIAVLFFIVLVIRDNRKRQQARIADTSKPAVSQQVTDLDSLWGLLDDDSREVIGTMYGHRNELATIALVRDWIHASFSERFISLSDSQVERAKVELEKRGLVADSKTDLGAFYITKSGIELVENYLKKRG